MDIHTVGCGTLLYCDCFVAAVLAGGHMLAALALVILWKPESLHRILWTREGRPSSMVPVTGSLMTPKSPSQPAPKSEIPGNSQTCQKGRSRACSGSYRPQDVSWARHLDYPPNSENARFLKLARDLPGVDLILDLEIASSSGDYGRSRWGRCSGRRRR